MEKQGALLEVLPETSHQILRGSSASHVFRVEGSGKACSTFAASPKALSTDSSQFWLMTSSLQTVGQLSSASHGRMLVGPKSFTFSSQETDAPS